MEESTLELTIGDIVYRNRIISKLIHGSSTETEYGPLTLSESNTTNQIKVIDFDGRRYKNITIPIQESDTEQVQTVTAMADDLVEKAYQEL